MWVQAEGLLEVGNASIPLSLASGNIGESFWHLAAAWQHFADALEGGFGRPVITQYLVLVITQGEQGFRGVRLEFLRVLQRFSCCIAASGSSVDGDKVNKRMRTRKSRPCKGKIGVKLHRPFVKIDGFHWSIEGVPVTRF